MHPLQFCNSLENILNTCKIELILGDFNINFHNEMGSQYLRQMMQRTHYLQIVKSATFISSGSLLDHVYVSQILSESLRNKVKCEIKSVVQTWIRVQGVKRGREGGIEEKGGQRVILVKRRERVKANNGGERERKERGKLRNGKKRNSNCTWY